MGNFFKYEKIEKEKGNDHTIEMNLLNPKKPQKNGQYTSIKSKSFNEFDRRSGINISSCTTLNIKIIGGARVGKTALVNRFMVNKFIDQHHFTWNTTTTKELIVQGWRSGLTQGNQVKINLIDSSSQENWIIQENMIVDPDGVILVVSIENLDLDSISTLLSKVGE